MTLQATPPISLGDVEAEFGAPSGTALGAFVRGGAWVPDGPAANAGVPTAKPISLGDMLGTVNGELFSMVAGVDGQTSGFNDGLLTVNQIGTMTPGDFRTREIFHLHKDNAGIQITMFQQNAGDLDINFWDSITFNGIGYGDFTILATEGLFLDNTGRATWAALPDSGSFFNGQTYSLLWT